jgi:hypothetical protein
MAGYLVAVIALPLGLGLFIGGLFMGHYSDEFGLLLNPLTPQGAVWLLIGLIALAAARRGRRRLNRLKDYGLRYDAEITNIRLWAMHIPARTAGAAAGRAECVYVNERGERCLVKSRAMMIGYGDSNATLGATVYVDRDDPARYEVEIFRKNSANFQVDRDYR